MVDSLRCVFRFMSSWPGRHEAAEFLEVSIDQPEIDVGEADAEFASFGFGQADQLGIELRH
ncbi:hypothetical protein FHT82_000544 [Rhizobium sp. BK275]|jgi:hypothetical protein|uniref:hypothetical protein n=1 Tax=unclassified Rhizobium TaxID=2613769 RepID=UPI00161BEF35|nr:MULTISPECIES: hypothetical protein [unclassified Rhizobium]MBB3387824.1 hypothetical protein [Rhizobium sp. BK275]MBB3407172.1 hypothetical protein [Rhizobium sp. BK316]